MRKTTHILNSIHHGTSALLGLRGGSLSGLDTSEDGVSHYTVDLLSRLLDGFGERLAGDGGGNEGALLDGSEGTSDESAAKGEHLWW